MDHRKYLSQIGTKGGKAGTGEAKVRGDSEHYRRISKLRKDNRGGNSKQRRQRKRCLNSLTGTNTPCTSS